MKKVVKAAVIAGVVVVVLIVGAMAAALVWIDSIARKGIEEGATYALMVPTTLNKADVGVFSGSFRMEGLAVANPDGFSRPRFLSLNEGGVQVDLNTLGRDVVELPELTLSGLEVSLLREGDSSNYGTILENLKRFESGKTGPAEPKGEGGKKFLIHRVQIRDVKAVVSLLPVGGEATTAEIIVPEIVLTDVGSDGSGVGLGEVAGIIVKAVIASLANAGGGVLPEAIADELQAGLEQLTSLSDLGIDVAADFGQGLENVVGQVQGEAGKAIEEAGKAVEEAGKQAEEAVRKATEGLKGVLPGGGGG